MGTIQTDTGMLVLIIAALVLIDGAVVMTMAIVRVHPVHLMNAV